MQEKTEAGGVRWTPHASKSSLCCLLEIIWWVPSFLISRSYRKGFCILAGVEFIMLLLFVVLNTRAVVLLMCMFRGRGSEYVVEWLNIAGSGGVLFLSLVMV